MTVIQKSSPCACSTYLNPILQVRLDLRNSHIPNIFSITKHSNCTPIILYLSLTVSSFRLTISTIHRPLSTSISRHNLPTCLGAISRHIAKSERSRSGRIPVRALQAPKPLLRPRGTLSHNPGDQTIRRRPSSVGKPILRIHRPEEGRLGCGLDRMAGAGQSGQTLCDQSPPGRNWLR